MLLQSTIDCAKKWAAESAKSLGKPSDLGAERLRMARLQPAPPIIDPVLRLAPQEVARRLDAALGRPLVALLTDVSNTRIVRTWVEDGDEPDAQRGVILRCALQATNIIAARFDSHVAQRWFVSGNSLLEADAPSAVLRAILEQDETHAGETSLRVLNAARAFGTR